eukprot:SAG11_NODE_26803_length_340_cov_1.294606_1_plen_27_part_10
MLPDLPESTDLWHLPEWRAAAARRAEA